MLIRKSWSRRGRSLGLASVSVALLCSCSHTPQSGPPVTTLLVLGLAQPNTVRRGDSFVISPTKVVQPICGQYATVFAIRNEASPIGTLGTGGEWQAATATGITIPACAVPPSDSAVRYTVGSQVPTGQMVVCLTFGIEAAGCAALTVLPA
jgi:hypothetical protein